MNRQHIEDAINSIILPDIERINPEEMKMRYRYLLGFLGIRKVTEICILNDIIEEKLQEETHRCDEENENIFMSIVSGNIQEACRKYEENKSKKKALKNMLLPFALFLNDTTEELIAKEDSYTELNTGERLKIVGRVLKKYYRNTDCGSILVSPLKKDPVRIIHGEMNQVIIMLAAAIKTYLQMIKKNTDDDLDELLIQIAGEVKGITETEGNNDSDIQILERKRTEQNKKEVCSLLSRDIENIEMILSGMKELTGNYICCIQSENYSRCAIGGTQESLERLICDIVIAVQNSVQGRKMTFNVIAKKIKACIQQV